MKFAMFFNGDPYSVIALDNMISNGHLPVALLVSASFTNEYHTYKINQDMMRRYQDCLGIHIIFYQIIFKFEMTPTINAVKEAKALGAEILISSDITNTKSYEYYQRVADSCSIDLSCPLWKKEEAECLKEFIAKKYKAVIIGIHHQNIPFEFIGKNISENFISYIKENNKYHSLTIDGPIFLRPLGIEIKDIKFDKKNNVIAILK